LRIFAGFLVIYASCLHFFSSILKLKCSITNYPLPRS
jgi:hypothetical protein